MEKCNKNILNERESSYIEKYKTYVYSNRKSLKGYNLTIGGDGVGELNDIKIEIFRMAQKSKPIYQIDLNGDIVKEWYGAREASKKLNIVQSCILNCLKGKRRTYKKHIWIYVDKYDENTFNLNSYVDCNTQPRKINQYDLLGKYIKTWNSANEAQKCGFDSSSIIKVCKRKYKTHKSYLWCYKNKNYE